MSPRITIGSCALSTLLLALWLAGPTFYWLDSAEFVAASYTLGVAHAPGHPLMSLLGRLFCYLPVGTIAFRLTLACAVQAALAAAAVGLITRRLVASAAETPSPISLTTHVACAVATLMAGWSYALLLQAVRTEVYALNALCTLAAAYALLESGERGDRRYLLAAALITGLGLCNHHLLMLLAVPGALLYLLLGWRRGAPLGGLHKRTAVGVLLAGLLGLTVLAYLPLRAARAPRVNWGAPQNVERFAWVILAQGFHQSVDRAAKESLGRRASGAAFAVAGALGPVGALLALAGLYVGWRRRQTRRATTLLAALAGGNLLSPLLVGFDPYNPDAHGYLAIAALCLAPAVGLLVYALGAALETLARHRRGLARAALVALPLLALALPATQLSKLSAVDLRDHWGAEETGRALLSQPPGALVLTSYYASVFASWALRGCWDLRPDLMVVHRNFLRQPGYTSNLARRHPSWRATLERWGHEGHLEVGYLRGLAQSRAVRLQADLNVPPPVAASLAPAGLLHALPSPAKPPPALEDHRRALAAWRGALGALKENESRRAVAWFHFLQALQACTHGPRGAAKLHLEALSRLTPKAKAYLDLQRRCRILHSRAH